MEYYQICYRDGLDAVPLDFYKLPEDLTESVSEDYIDHLVSFNQNSGMSEKPVLYFRKVSKFRKGIVSFLIPGSDLMFGIE